MNVEINDSQEAGAVVSVSAINAAAPRARGGVAEDLLPVADCASVLLAAVLAHLLMTVVAVPGAAPDSAASALSLLAPLIWIAAAFAPFVLYESRFSALAACGSKAQLLAAFVRHWLVLTALIAAIAAAGRWLEWVSVGWLGIWWSSAVLLTAGSRILVTRQLTDPALSGEHAGGSVGAVPSMHGTGTVADSLVVRLVSECPILRWNAVLKACSDAVLALLVCIALLPVLCIIAVAIRIDSPGPIIYRQRRHGLSNRIFDIYKFRTMRSDGVASAAGLQQTVRGDVRITRVGRILRKWSLDELPQLFNVLEGSMAVVGPRPHAVDMRTEAKLGHEIICDYAHRHRVRPGITGWAQVHGARGATDTVAQLCRRVELDIQYIERWSPLLDLRILLMTPRAVLRATNAY